MCLYTQNDTDSHYQYWILFQQHNTAVAEEDERSSTYQKVGGLSSLHVEASMILNPKLLPMRCHWCASVRVNGYQ